MAEGMADTSKPIQIAIASTFTSEPVRESLEFWATQFGWALNIRFAPFNQLFQQLLDPGSTLSANKSGVNVLLVRWDDLLPQGEATPPDVCERLLPRIASDLEAALRTAIEQGASAHIVVLARSEVWTAEKRHTFEHDVAARLSSLPGVSAFTSHWIVERYPVTAWQDRHADHIGRVPYTPEYFAALGTTVARSYFARHGRPYKVIVLDCDNTLWGGVAGEDGPLGVRMDAPYRTLQRFMVEQADSGRLLCLCSKNSESDVRAVFEQRSDMPLAWNRIAAFRVNWDSKADNIESLAAELNLGLDSFVFVDDNPIECAAVRAAHPEVLTIQLPERPDDIGPALQHVWAFDTARVTSEDRRRGAMYQENSERERARQTSSSLAAFIEGLELRVGIAPVTGAGVARASQMTLRTNQFNSTTERRSEEDVRGLLGNPAALCVQVDLADRFGDSGTVGLAIGFSGPDKLNVDSLLLSCRALGRGVEHRLVAYLGRWALDQGLSTIHFRFRRSERNEPLERFFDEMGELNGAAWDRSTSLVLPASIAAAVQFDAGRVSSGDAPMSSERESAPAAGRAAPDALRLIPVQWRSASEIWASIGSAVRVRPELQSTFVEPGSRMEQDIARIWRDVLRIDRVGLDDRFADLGGSSLSVVRVHGRLLDELGVNLDITELFQHATVRTLAAHIGGMGTERATGPTRQRADKQLAAFAALGARAARSPARAGNRP
jgi:FkbH-like protein